MHSQIIAIHIVSSGGELVKRRSGEKKNSPKAEKNAGLTNGEPGRFCRQCRGRRGRRRCPGCPPPLARHCVTVPFSALRHPLCANDQQQGVGAQLPQPLPQPQLLPPPLQQQHRMMIRMMIQQQLPPPKKPLLHIMNLLKS